MDLYEFDSLYRNGGCSVIAGIDEAGRGPLAGPVVAAAVILPADLRLQGIRDSKKIRPRERDYLYDLISENALSLAVGSSTAEEIDSLNILEASKLAMCRALNSLSILPDLLLIDALKLPQIERKQEAIIKGDSKSASIAAASIIAKVTRDRIMMEFHRQYPQYGFDRHKGYPTKAHRASIMRFGLSPIHRKTFRLL